MYKRQGTLTGTTTSVQGNIANSGNVTFDQASNGTYAGNLSGAGSLTKSGTGNVTLSGANTYSGGTTVSAGTLLSFIHKFTIYFLIRQSNGTRFAPGL